MTRRDGGVTRENVQNSEFFGSLSILYVFSTISKIARYEHFKIPDRNSRATRKKTFNFMKIYYIRERSKGESSITNFTTHWYSGQGRESEN